jgi:hypothetical protein
MSKFICFILGNISGVYICQNYKVPNIKKLSDKIVEYINSLEKN